MYRRNKSESILKLVILCECSLCIAILHCNIQSVYKNLENLKFSGDFSFTFESQGLLWNFISNRGNFGDFIFKFKFRIFIKTLFHYFFNLLDKTIKFAEQIKKISIK